MLHIIITLVLFLVLPFIASLIIFFIYYWFKGLRPKPHQSKIIGHGSKLYRIFVQLPHRLVLDWFNRDLDTFPEYGIRLICGEQGSGKTVTLAYLLRWYQRCYPLLKVKTNFGFIAEDGAINDYRDIIASHNDHLGEIDCIDEVQNWFSSLQSKDFPIEMLNEITQQRKQRKMVLCTSQVFTRVAKPIREQTYLIYEPYTFFGCLTFVIKKKPLLDASGNVDKYKFRGCFFFVHDDDLRNSFDTYRKIESMFKSGFKPLSERYGSDPSIINNINNK
jgi:hypothetical protein